MLFVGYTLVFLLVILFLYLEHLLKWDKFAWLIRNESHSQANCWHRHNEHTCNDVIKINLFIPITFTEFQITLIYWPRRYGNFPKQTEEWFELFRIFLLFNPRYVTVSHQKHINHASYHVGTAHFYGCYNSGKAAIFWTEMSDLAGVLNALLKESVFEF